MNDIRPLKDVVDVNEKFPILPVAVLILAALVIGAFIYFKKKKAAEKTYAPPMPAEEIAREAMRALKEKKLIEKGLIKDFYIVLSDIIRAYIENRYRIFAMDRTTWELFQEMKSKRIERPYADKINDFLEDCDMVKFAKYTPDQKEIEDVYGMAEEIIEITTPKITT